MRGELPDLGGVLSFGETDDAASTFITNYDERCAMVNFDPDSARLTRELLKAIVRERQSIPQCIQRTSGQQDNGAANPLVRRPALHQSCINSQVAAALQVFFG